MHKIVQQRNVLNRHSLCAFVCSHYAWVFTWCVCLKLLSWNNAGWRKGVYTYTQEPVCSLLQHASPQPAQQAPFSPLGLPPASLYFLGVCAQPLTEGFATRYRCNLLPFLLSDPCIFFKKAPPPALPSSCPHLPPASPWLCSLKSQQAAEAPQS